MALGEREPTRQRGLSLIEIMVALTVSLVLMAGVIQIFLGNKQTYTLGQGVARMQETGRFTITALSQDLRMAGYQGCADPKTIAATVQANPSPTADPAATALLGYEGGASSWSPALGFTAPSVNNSDVVAVQHGSGTVAALAVGGMASAGADVPLSANPGGLEAGDLAVIADCGAVDLFRISSVSGNDLAHASTHNISADLTRPYAEEATVMRFLDNAYYVDDSGRTNAAGQPVLSLYRRDVSGASVELVEGVENLQVLYGERLASGNIRYTTADNVGDMQSVVTVRVGLLVSSVDPARDTNDAGSGAAGCTAGYWVLDTCVPPAANDRRLRRVFTTTVTLRNRRGL